MESVTARAVAARPPGPLGSPGEKGGAKDDGNAVSGVRGGRGFDGRGLRAAPDAAPRGVSALERLRFDNSFTRELPADPVDRNATRQVRGACYSRVRPAPAPAPKLLAHSREVLALLELDEDAWQSPEFVAVLSGNRVLDGMDPFAMCYGGHQFGSWAGQLGDGRAINLGEVLTSAGERWMLQLKGPGPTPYSRHADGWAVLRSSVREFLCSEAMHHLGVPTTRALSLVTTGRTVFRDMFYDGNPGPESGAVVCRVAPSFTRFGNFEILASRNEHPVLRRLVDYTIRTSFPALGTGDEADVRWFETVCTSTARLMVEWMRVGFVHGVMNTDNMSILGQTIDYGPYGWLEDYDPHWTPNTTDASGRRYRFGQQAQIALWNLARLAAAISPVIKDQDGLEAALHGYARTFDDGFRAMMARKLGFKAFQPEDQALIEELQIILQNVETDMTLFYRGLMEVAPDGTSLAAPLEAAYYVPEQRTPEYGARLDAWLRAWLARGAGDGPLEERRARMRLANPLYVMRNYLAQLAIDDAETGDPARIMTQLEVLRRPYDVQPGREEFAARRPDWARNRAGCSMLSCSS